AQLVSSSPVGNQEKEASPDHLGGVQPAPAGPEDKKRSSTRKIARIRCGRTEDHILVERKMLPVARRGGIEDGSNRLERDERIELIHAVDGRPEKPRLMRSQAGHWVAELDPLIEHPDSQPPASKRPEAGQLPAERRRV